MGVRPGYKRSEAGLIPEDWDSCTLDKAILLLSGHHILGQYCNRRGDGVPYLTGPADFPGGVILQTKFTTRPSTLCQPEDILVTVKGSGAGTLVVADNVYCISRQLMAIRPSVWNKRFVFYSLLGCASQFRAASTGLIPGLSRSDILDQSLPVPPVPEQQLIATALSDVDALTRALERLVAKKRDLKQAAMQELLTGNTRLPGFSGTWEEPSLGELGECIIGLTYKPENVVEHGLLVLRASNIQNGRLLYDDNVHVNLEVPERLHTHQGDILVCVRNGSRALIGKCAVIDETAAGVTFGAFMSVYRTKYWRFIIHAFQGDSIQRQIRDNIGATINQITNKDMKAFRVKLPPEDEQTAIANVLSDMDAEVAALEHLLAKTRALKQGMMQELLTGKTRLVPQEAPRCLSAHAPSDGPRTV